MRDETKKSIRSLSDRDNSAKNEISAPQVAEMQPKNSRNFEEGSISDDAKKLKEKSREDDKGLLEEEKK